MMKGESDGQNSYTGAKVRELSGILGKTGIFYSRVANADLAIEKQILKFEYSDSDFFLHIGGNYGIVGAYKTVIEETKTEVSKTRKQFEEHEEDLIGVYGEERVKSSKGFLFDTLDEEYRKFDASVEEYEKLIEGLDLKELFENYKRYRERSSQIALDKPFTDKDIKNDLLAVEILVPVSEESEKLKITKPYENLEELRKYL
ncbi:MAG: hypothetical protein KAT28_00235 [Candidatus Aenigmarchaeota archaeon]|nr:hypothetical protein [Candidatus Aenigmarchaeota archaeon]